MTRDKFLQQYKDIRWQKKRLEIFTRDNYTCQSCGAKENISLNLHHKYYRKNTPPWDYPDEALISLCEGCHKIEKDQSICFESCIELIKTHCNSFDICFLESFLDRIIKFDKNGLASFSWLMCVLKDKDFQEIIQYINKKYKNRSLKNQKEVELHPELYPF
jgi:hypothetical protein